MKPKIEISSSVPKFVGVGDWVWVLSREVWNLHVIAQTQPGQVQLLCVTNSDCNRNEASIGPVKYDKYPNIGAEAVAHLFGDRPWKHAQVTITAEQP